MSSLTTHKWERPSLRGFFNRRRLLFFLAIAALACGGWYYYQTFTTVSYEVLVFNQVTGPTISPVPTSANPGTNCRAANTSCAIQNVGTGSHLLTYCITGGTVATFAIELEGSNDTASPPGNWIQVSNQDTSLIGTAGCGVLEAAGYFQYLRANLITLTGTNPVITAWYTGVGNAIPGGGLINGQKASQPITQIPALAFENTALTASAVNITTGVAATLYYVGAYNPNASPVYVVITGGPTPLSFGVGANASRDIPLAPGTASTGTVSIGCATSPGGSGNPGTGCVVTVLYKPFQTINTQITSSGTVSASKGQIGN
jgi:hypothetical protein